MAIASIKRIHSTFDISENLNDDADATLLFQLCFSLFRLLDWCGLWMCDVFRTSLATLPVSSHLYSRFPLYWFIRRKYNTETIPCAHLYNWTQPVQLYIKWIQLNNAAINISAVFIPQCDAIAAALNGNAKKLSKSKVIINFNLTKIELLDNSEKKNKLLIDDCELPEWKKLVLHVSTKSIESFTIVVKWLDAFYTFISSQGLRKTETVSHFSDYATVNGLWHS